MLAIFCVQEKPHAYMPTCTCTLTDLLYKLYCIMFNISMIDDHNH